MKIYILSSADFGLVQEERPHELVEDILWAGTPYPSLEAAQKEAQEDAGARCRDNLEEDAKPLQWEPLQEEDRQCWRTAMEELSMHYLIREYDF